jgi:hypothetical protein
MPTGRLRAIAPRKARISLQPLDLAREFTSVHLRLVPEPHMIRAHVGNFRVQR